MFIGLIKSAKVVSHTCLHTHGGPDFHPSFLDYDKERLSAVSPGESCSVCGKEESRHIVVLYQRRVSKVDSASYFLDCHNCHAFRSLHPLISDGFRRLLKSETAFSLIPLHARPQVALSSIIERSKATILGPLWAASVLGEEVGLDFYVAISSVSLFDVLEVG